MTVRPPFLTPFGPSTLAVFAACFDVLACLHHCGTLRVCPRCHGLFLLRAQPLLGLLRLLFRLAFPVPPVPPSFRPPAPRLRSLSTLFFAPGSTILPPSLVFLSLSSLPSPLVANFLFPNYAPLPAFLVPVALPNTSSLFLLRHQPPVFLGSLPFTSVALPSLFTQLCDGFPPLCLFLCPLPMRFSLLPLLALYAASQVSPWDYHTRFVPWCFFFCVSISSLLPLSDPARTSHRACRPSPYPHHATAFTVSIRSYFSSYSLRHFPGTLTISA